MVRANSTRVLMAGWLFCILMVYACEETTLLDNLMKSLNDTLKAGLGQDVRVLVLNIGYERCTCDSNSPCCKYFGDWKC